MSAAQRFMRTEAYRSKLPFFALCSSALVECLRLFPKAARRKVAAAMVKVAIQSIEGDARRAGGGGGTEGEAGA